MRSKECMFGTLLTMWKIFHYSPEKAEKLAEIQAALDSPELKIQKPSDTRWLAREQLESHCQPWLPHFKRCMRVAILRLVV